MTEQHQECNCHDCTQARYRNSFQFQIDQAIRPAEPEAAVSEGKKEHGDAEQIVERINSKINMMLWYRSTDSLLK